MLTRNPIVEVKNLRHFYRKGSGGDFLVLDDINLTLYEDEIVCLIGRSGSGKSTLLKCISGLIHPTEGSVTIEEKTEKKSREDIAMVFQNFALFPWLTVLENVEIGLRAQNLKLEEYRRRALSAIDLIGLDGYEGAYPRELSGGMQQRVGLARAVVVKPQLLLMDEPFSELDVLTAEILRTDLLDLWIEGIMTIKSILMVTHNIEEAVLMADRILILGSNPGRIIDEIQVTLSHPRNRLASDCRALVEVLYGKMTSKEVAFSQGGLFPGIGISMALPHISSNILQGFMETVASSYNGQADLPQLAMTLSMEDGDILKIAEILQLFRFCELEGSDIRLTAKGIKCAAGTIDERKKIFRDHLERYIPLAAHIRDVLNERHDHAVPISHFRNEIENFMPRVSAEETLKAVTSWARYAELFAYDEKTGKFFLEEP